MLSSIGFFRFTNVGSAGGSLRWYSPTVRLFASLLTTAALVVTPSHACVQSTAILLGRVVDSAGAVVGGVGITVRYPATNLERFAQTDSEGNYQIADLPVGPYRVEVHAQGFQTEVVDNLVVEVGRS